MSTSTDQIQEIKKAEEEAKNRIEKERNDLIQKEMKLKDQLEKSAADFAHELRQKHVSHIENVKKEADQSKKKQLTEAESKKNALIADSKSKENDAVSLVIATFTDHIKA